MPFVSRMTASGLVLQETLGGEAEVGRALKEIDDKLVLQKHPGQVEGGWVYKVFALVSDDQEPHCILTWADEYGTPLPLSSGILDEVRKLRRDVRERHGLLDADAKNALHVARVQAKGRAEADEIVAEHRARLERSQTQVSFSTVGKPGADKGRVRPRSGVAR